MRRITAILILALALGGSGCKSSEKVSTHHSFPFQYEGVEYEIVSVVAPDGSGHNYVIRREDGNLAFSAKDEDQNGTMDTVLTGSESVEDAHAIYLAGIEFARANNRYRESLGTRTFELTISGRRYAVKSFIGGDGEVYNFITYFEPDGSEVICVDDAADGVLDRVKKGEPELASLQPAYSTVLDAGIGRGRIKYSDGHYVVRSEQ